MRAKDTTALRDRSQAEARFAEVFTHLGFLRAYARRRNARDPEGIAAEAMAIAWRRLDDVPLDDARPWLIATTRNLLLSEHRREHPTVDVDMTPLEAPEASPAGELDLDPELAAALGALSEPDREALQLVAWEDLTPAQAAASLGISPVAFRVRLHRARRRLANRLGNSEPSSDPAPAASRTLSEAEWSHS